MALDPAGVQLVAQDANQFFGDMDRAEKAVHSFSDATEKAGGRVGAAGEMMIGAFRRVGAFGVEMLAEAGRALFDFGVDSVSVAGDFEAGMNRFEAAAGDIDASGLEEFRDLFLDIGKELPVSTGDVQDAAIELVKGGLDPAILSAGGLKDAIQFAAAAELDLAEAATIAVKQLGVWTSATATAEEQTAFLAMSQDLLVRAAGASTVNVDKLNAAMNNAGGQARALNLDYKDFVTGLTLVSPAFGSAEQAGTGFNVFLKQLQPSTDPATAAMQELGLWTRDTGSAFFDAEGQYIGNREAAELLKQATEGLTDAKKAELLQTIFGIDGMVTANTLAAQGAEGYDILAGKIEKASGVQATAALKQAGYNTALDNAKGSLEAMQITIGSYLLPILSTLLNDYISPGINQITEFADVIFAAGGPVETLGNYFRAVVEDGDTLNDFLGNLPEPLQNIAYAIGEVIAFGQEVVAFFQSAGDEGSELGGVLDDLSAIWDNLWAAVQMVAAGYESYVMAVFGQVQAFLDTHGEEIEQFIGDAWEHIQNIINVALPLISGIITGTFLVISDFINQHGEEIQRILENAWAIISNVIMGALEIIEGVLTAALAVFQGDWEGAWTAIREMSEGVVKRIWEVIKAGLDLVAMLFDTSLEEIIGTWRYNFEQFPKIALAIGRDLYSAGEALIQNIWDGVTAKWQAFKDWLEAQWESVRDMLPGSEPKDSSSPLRNLDESGAAILENISAGIRGAGSSLTNAMQEVTTDFSGAAKGMLDQVSTFMSDRVSGILSGMGKLFNPNEAESPLSKLTESGEGIIGNLSSGMQNEIPGLIGSMQELTSNLVTEAEQMAREAGKAFKEELEQQMQDARDILPGSEPKDSGSPLSGLDESGAAFILNILDGMQETLPTLLTFVSDMGAKMVEGVEDATRQISRLMADAFGSQADIYQQQESNLERLESLRGDLSAMDFAVLETSLGRALSESQQFADPKQAAEYYDLQSRYAFKLADLRSELAETEDHDARERILERIRLTEKAWAAETKAFEERQKAQENPYKALFDQVQELISSITVEGDMPPALMALMEMLNQLGGFAGPPPGLATGGPAESGKDYIVGEEGPEFFVPHKDGMVISNAMSQMFDRLASPVMSGAQQMAGTTNNYYGQVGSNFPMSLFTNNSPAALWQSYQMIQAMAAWGP